MTYQQTIFGEELELTDQQSSAEDFPASRFPWLESKKAKGTTVISGRKCSELSESLRRVGSSVRTYLESCALPLTTFVRTWSVLATKSGYLILKLRLSERRIDGNGSRLLPTPVSTLGTNGGPNQRDSSGRPGLQMAVKMWPTPTQRDYKDGSAQSCANVPVNGLLGRAVHLFATPNAAHAQGTSGGGQGRDLRTDVGGQMNPTWVEWLMGFPLGWTDLNASETR